ncbi:alpha/beta fold hydrolase [Pseudohongiella spirulinae]|uniref:Alpha/beta hydrolase n=1 Tax=Pseudohongiella spirulinae TaxID=1249552 RepID=A0A0S2KAU9_9GAMM|nr:alpha/beta fold hydrolase [Pseudohongiella spirulinae]ALO45214.1 Alpha/beta hydrolase [Pseudohongiella spirulinae]
MTDALELNYRQYSSEGKPLIILHGLFGSLTNWTWHSKKFAEHFSVYALDLRNHGASPHADSMSYAQMSGDVLRFMDAHHIEKAHILGHSMGGKVAMQMALTAPQRVDKLVVADIAPVQYGGERGEHDEIFEGMCALQLEILSSRADADKQLAEWVNDEIVRQFLLSNLVRRAGDGFEWRINLPALKKCYPALRARPEAHAAFDGPVLFVRGDLSDYIQPQHKDEVLSLFPAAQIKTIMQTGHWLHAEKPDTFNRIVADFLLDES